jgi:hypothetical protein
VLFVLLLENFGAPLGFAASSGRARSSGARLLFQVLLSFWSVSTMSAMPRD